MVLMKQTPVLSLIVFVLLLCVYGTYCLAIYRPFSFADNDPGWQIEAVRSLVADRDLDLRNQLNNDPAQAQDQTARGVRGEWYPLHEFLLAFIALPFYLAIGINGCLILNVLLACLIFSGSFLLCRIWASNMSSLAAALFVGSSPFFMQYSYSFSIDVLGCCLAVWAFLAVAEGKSLLGGALCGLAVLARNSYVVLLPVVVLLICLRKPAGRVSHLLCLLLGGAPLLALLLGLNWWMYGGLLQTSYHHWLVFNGSALVESSQESSFKLAHLSSFGSFLFNSSTGLLVTAPALIVGLPLGARLLWLRKPAEALALAFCCLLLLLFFGSFSPAFPGAFGNRYLMLIGAFSAAPLAAALDNIARTGPD